MANKANSKAGYVNVQGKLYPGDELIPMTHPNGDPVQIPAWRAVALINDKGFVMGYPKKKAVKK